MFRVLGLVLCTCLVGPAAHAATVFATDRVDFEVSRTIADPVVVEQSRAPDAMLPHGSVVWPGIARVIAFASPVSLALVGAGYAVPPSGDLHIDGRRAAFFEASARTESRAALLWSLGLGALVLDAFGPAKPEDANQPTVADVPLPASLLLLLAGIGGLAGLARFKRKRA